MTNLNNFTLYTHLSLLVRLLRCRAIGLLLMPLLLMSTFAYSNFPSAGQIEQFKNLPKSQQEELMKQYGIEVPTTSTTAAPSDSPIAVPTIVEKKEPRETDASNSIERNVKQSAVGVTSEAEKKQAKDDFGILAEQLEENEEIKLFGYELFSGTPSTFAPATDIPVPATYVIGPGDTAIVQLYGKKNTTHELTVNREGLLQFPDIGPISVVGLSFRELKEVLHRTVKEQMIGVQSSITMGNLRSIRIFVLGDVQHPGSYTISSLSTITNALFVSGGLSKVGSMRNIQLKRKGEIISAFDLYDLLLKGDTSDDTRLLPGDVIFVPPIGKTVGISGEVKRPAIYELKSEVNAKDIIALAGGFLPTAYPKASRIERIDKHGFRTMLDVNLKSNKGLKAKVRDADVIRVYPVLDTIENVVVLDGHVKRPGGFAWRKGMRVTDVLSSVNDLLPNPDLNYALVRRELQPTREIQVLRLKLREALQAPGSIADLLLEPRDQILIFGLNENRVHQVSKVVDQLRFQTRHQELPPIAKISGNVWIPGDYPIYDGMTLDGLIESSMELKPDTDRSYAIISRHIKGKAEIEVLTTDLNTSHKNTVILPGDEVFIFHLDEDRAASIASVVDKLKIQGGYQDLASVVTISGNVRIPGTYPMYEGMTLADLLDASRNIKLETDKDYVVIKRTLPNQSKIEVATTSLSSLGLETELKADDQVFIFSLTDNRPEMMQALLGKLKAQADNDEITQVVNIGGHVRFPGEYPLTSDLTVEDIISYAGGLTDSAYGLDVEVTRYSYGKLQERNILHIPVELNNPEQEAIVLQAGDTVTVKQRPNWVSVETVELEGEFRFPGVYTIRPGETLGQIVTRAGGVTDYAYLKGAVYTRDSLQQLEAQRLGELQKRLKSDIAAARLEKENSDKTDAEAVATANKLLEDLSETEAMGRLVIDMEAIVAGYDDYDFTVEGGDRIVVPKRKSGVTVMGEVQFATTHLYEQRLNAYDYIEQSGGTTSKADEKRVFIVKANGKIIRPKRSSWFRRKNVDVEAGDTVVVPLDATKVEPLTAWTNVTQIIYQMALAAAAVAAL